MGECRSLIVAEVGAAIRRLVRLRGVDWRGKVLLVCVVGIVVGCVRVGTRDLGCLSSFEQ